MPGDAILNMRDPLQGCVPAGLEFAGHQTLGRVDDLVTAGGCPASAPVRQKGRVEEGRISGPS
jgi:hypothetical protein